MATTAQSSYCFEILTAALEKRPALSLAEVEELWDKYKLYLSGENDASEAGGNSENPELGDGEEHESGELYSDSLQKTLKPRDILRLQAQSPASSSSSSSPSTVTSATSSTTGLAGSSRSSSKSSLFSFGHNKSPQVPVENNEEKEEEEYPLFVTWNTLDFHGNKSLRGCIGTFEAGPVSLNLKDYSLTSYVHSFSEH